MVGQKQCSSSLSPADQLSRQHYFPVVSQPVEGKSARRADTFLSIYLFCWQMHLWSRINSLFYMHRWTRSRIYCSGSTSLHLLKKMVVSQTGARLSQKSSIWLSWPMYFHLSAIFTLKLSIKIETVSWAFLLIAIFWILISHRSSNQEFLRSIWSNNKERKIVQKQLIILDTSIFHLSSFERICSTKH